MSIMRHDTPNSPRFGQTGQAQREVHQAVVRIKLELFRIVDKAEVVQEAKKQAVKSHRQAFRPCQARIDTIVEADTRELQSYRLGETVPLHQRKERTVQTGKERLIEGEHGEMASASRRASKNPVDY